MIQGGSWLGLGPGWGVPVSAMPAPACWLALPPTLRGHLSQVEVVGGAGGGARPVLGGDACDVISSSTSLSLRPLPGFPPFLQPTSGGTAGRRGRTLVTGGPLTPASPTPPPPFLKGCMEAISSETSASRSRLHPEACCPGAGPCGPRAGMKHQPLCRSLSLGKSCVLTP